MIELKDGASDLFEMVKTSASSMSKLIDDLLYYSKNVENNEGKLDVQILADSVLKLIRIDNK
jgi:signal transduction histidine kinase